MHSVIYLFLSFEAPYCYFIHYALCITFAEGELQRDGAEEYYFRAAADVADWDAVADFRRYGTSTAAATAIAK